MAYVFIIILFVYTFSLKERIKRLEEKSGQKPVEQPLMYPEMVKSAQSFAPQSMQPVTPLPGVLPPIPAPAAFIPPPPLPPEQDSALIHFFKEDFLVKLGALLLLFAFGWGVSYAFINNWISPAGRILIGLVAGAGILAFGTFWMRKNFHQAAIFLVLGLSVVNLTIFAARFIYDFLNPPFALALMFVAVAYVAYISVLRSSHNLALACLIFAGISPLFTAGEPSTVGLFSYLLIFVLGVIWVVSLRMWHALTLAALLVVSGYSFPYWVGGVQGLELFMGLVFAHMFGIVFFLFNGLNIARGVTKVLGAHIYTALGTGLFLIVWVLIVADGLAESLPLLLWTTVYLLAAIYFLSAKENLTAFYLHGAVGLLLGAVATATIFDGHALTIAYTLETGLIVLMSQLITRNAAVTKQLCLLFVGPTLLSLGSLFSSSWNTSVIHKDFFALLTLVIVLGMVGVALRSLEREAGLTELKQSANSLIAGAVLYAMVLILRCVGVYYDGDIITMILIVESGALVFFAHSIYSSRLLTTRLSYILGLSWLLTFPSIGSSLWDTGVLHTDFSIILLFIGVAALVGMFLRLLNQFEPHHEIVVAMSTAFSGAAINSLILIWLSLHAAIPSDDVATTVSLVVFTILGLSSFVYGRSSQHIHFKYAGGILLAFVVGRLLLVDVWDMPLLERFVTFFLVGVLLISTAFYGRKKTTQ
jgi:uncharacterized membrane protein